ncbi:hypothetical protein ACFVS9_20050 [Streptomyces sp. NPDC058008]|uniref:hypothetical protein n=1 Tax=Streptomyces sp. NPDC058008 TaxID=3346303 RepID=UPI0036EB4383
MREGDPVREYRLTWLLLLVPSMVASGTDGIGEPGWGGRLWGAAEIVLAVCVLVGAAMEIRAGRIRRRAGRGAGGAEPDGRP